MQVHYSLSESRNVSFESLYVCILQAVSINIRHKYLQSHATTQIMVSCSGQ
jgi:hypothetical protein